MAKDIILGTYLDVGVILIALYKKFKMIINQDDLIKNEKFL